MEICFSEIHLNVFFTNTMQYITFLFKPAQLAYLAIKQILLFMYRLLRGVSVRGVDGIIIITRNERKGIIS